MFHFNLYIVLLHPAVLITCEVRVTINPSKTNGSSVHFNCTYDLKQHGLKLASLMWIFQNEDIDELIFEYNYNSPNSSGPLGRFKDRIINYATVTDTQHTMTLNQTNWCNDIGYYTCKIWSLQSPPLLELDTQQLEGMISSAAEAVCSYILNQCRKIKLM